MYQNFEFSDIGTKNIQEDAKLTFKYKQYIFFFIFDGHGYKPNSVSLVHYLLKNNYLKKKLIFFVDNNNLSIDTIKLFFIDLDKLFIKNKINSGVCLSGIISDGKKIYLLNLGDTLLYGFDKNKNIILNMSIHNLNNQKEIQRIINYNKQSYIKNNRYKKLSMTRCLGDSDCKDNTNEPLISIPEIIETNFNNYKYFLLSSDGINMRYDINIIIQLYNDYDNKKLYNYCIKTCTVNKTKSLNVDNIYFIIIHTKNINKNIMYNIFKYIDYISPNSVATKVTS